MEQADKENCCRDSLHWDAPGFSPNIPEVELSYRCKGHRLTRPENTTRHFLPLSLQELGLKLSGRLAALMAKTEPSGSPRTGSHLGPALSAMGLCWLNRPAHELHPRGAAHLSLQHQTPVPCPREMTTGRASVCADRKRHLAFLLPRC